MQNNKNYAITARLLCIFAFKNKIKTGKNYFNDKVKCKY